MNRMLAVIDIGPLAVVALLVAGAIAAFWLWLKHKEKTKAPPPKS